MQSLIKIRQLQNKEILDVERRNIAADLGEYDERKQKPENEKSLTHYLRLSVRL